MTSGNQIARAVRLTLIASAMAASPAALAQQAGDTSAQASLEEVVVTGTRITTPNVVANSPVTSVSAEELTQRQPIAVEEVIKQLPVAVPAIGPGTNNGTGGGATIDLRGLGPARTLVLVDGRRVVPFNLAAAVDTNVIPLALLERVDVVTGGASAVYGADAVAGVANFILRRDFEGIDLSANYGFSGENDTKRYRADAVMGTNVADGRGNLTLALGYSKSDPLLQGEREFGLTSLSSTTGNPQGSGTTIPVAIDSGARQLDVATGRFVPLFETFNFNPVNYFQTPLDRYQANALGTFEINDFAEAYTHLMYTRSLVKAQLASSGSFFNTYRVPIGNPFLPQAAREQLCAENSIAAANCVVGNTTEVALSLGRRFEELGPRLNDFENRVFQYTLGVRGDLPFDGWSYDAYYSRGEADQVSTRVNWGSLSKVQQALRAVSPTTCLNTANGCVPLNIFGPNGSITPAMVRFINLDSISLTQVRQEVASASLSGDLGGTFKSPFTENHIGVAVGAEYRNLFAANRSDSAAQIQGEVLGTGAPTPDRRGEYDLTEFFAEANVPLVSDVPGVHSLSLELGYRYSEFKVADSTDYGSYKYGAEWAPIEGLRFRGMFQRATRSPNINELFAPLVTGLSNLAVDPCQGNRINAGQANTAGTLSNLCRLTGVPLAAIGNLAAPSAGQINSQSGGNPALEPEKADTVSFGVVFQPTFVNGLTITADYWQIELTDAISAPSSSDILNDCYDPARNPGLTFNAACAQVQRNTLNGTFNGVEAPGVLTPLSNLGRYWVSGVDVGIAYGFSFGDVGLSESLGRLNLSVNATRTTEWEFQATPNSVRRDCLGFYSIACNESNGPGTNLPHETKVNTRIGWVVGPFDAALNWRYLSSVTEEPGGTAFLPRFSKIEAFNYLDLSLGWEALDNVRLSLTVNNLTDKDPPVVGNTIGGTTSNSGNTFPQFYDPIGRYFTLGAAVTF